MNEANLLLLWPGIDSIEINYYFNAAIQAWAGKQLYTDFNWIYSPALLLVFMGITAIFKTLELFTGTWATMLTTSGVILWIGLYRFSKTRLAVSLPYLQLTSASLAVFLTVSVAKAFINPDLLVALLVFAALWLQTQSSYKKLAVFLLGIAAALRLYPAVLLPLFGEHPFLNRKTLIRAILFCVPILAMFLPFGFEKTVTNYLSDGLLFHVTRPVEVGSISASLMFVATLVGEKISSEANMLYHVLYVQFAYPPPSWWTYLVQIKELPMIIAIYLLAKKFFQGKSAYTAPGSIYGLSILLIMAAIIRSPVFSSQYLIWIWSPFFMWLAEGKRHRWLSGKQLGAMLLLMVLVHISNSVYLVYYLSEHVAALVQLESAPQLVIGIKNGLFLLLFGLVSHQVWKQKTNVIPG